LGNLWERLTVFKEPHAIALDHDDTRESLLILGPVVWEAYWHLKVVIKKIPKRYGSNGNSFVCAVEFGTKIKAKSLLWR
jgi:hypothetical protein